MTAALDMDAKSHTSYKSTHSSRSSVLERAREYTRKMEGDAASRRTRSLERQQHAAMSSSPTASTPRSQSAGRPSHSGNRPATRERAMASIEKENQRQQQPSGRVSNEHSRPKPSTPTTQASARTNGDLTVSTSQRTAKSQGTTSRSLARRQTENNGEGHDAVVSPELLVDALSGHEDGLLAIAERLMEHYDSGYDVMGEAIIDAFADVQKLFQHVVEAAHMEGAAFESSRREEEMKQRKKKDAGMSFDQDDQSALPSPSGPVRHDEFIDQDVKDCLSEAIRQGTALKSQNKHLECYELYEQACQSASSLLPVDSDHRGRLQLSIARAESMSPDRACAILRYAMDDVLRSGMRAGNVALPDPSKRADVVLSKPKAHPSMSASGGLAGVVQSSEEQLNSLVEEMKEILGAPVYKDTPLQGVAKRFWVALTESQKAQNRNEERLEQHLGKLKGDYLLARAEWEEKLNRAEEQADEYKRSFLGVKDSSSLMENARSASHSMHPRSVDDDDESRAYNNFRSSNSMPRGADSVASLTSSMAQHARTLVGSFACSGNNERYGGFTTPSEGREDRSRPSSRYADEEWRDRRRSNSGPPSRQDNLGHGSAHKSNQKSRSFRQYSDSPRRVDV